MNESRTSLLFLDGVGVLIIVVIIALLIFGENDARRVGPRRLFSDPPLKKKKKKKLVRCSGGLKDAPNLNRVGQWRVLESRGEIKGKGELAGSSRLDAPLVGGHLGGPPTVQVDRLYLFSSSSAVAASQALPPPMMPFATLAGYTKNYPQNSWIPAMLIYSARVHKPIVGLGGSSNSKLDNGRGGGFINNS